MHRIIRAIIYVIAVCAIVFGLYVFSNARALAGRCKDAPVNLGPFPTTAHVCDNGDGTVTSCWASVLPMSGGSCRDWPESSLPPGFWNS